MPHCCLGEFCDSYVNGRKQLSWAEVAKVVLLACSYLYEPVRTPTYSSCSRQRRRMARRVEAAAAKDEYPGLEYVGKCCGRNGGVEFVRLPIFSGYVCFSC